MDLFRYQGGRLFAEDVEVERIAAQVGTPAYIYSKGTFLDHLHKMQEAYALLDTTICFSVKACAPTSGPFSQNRWREPFSTMACGNWELPPRVLPRIG